MLKYGASEGTRTLDLRFTKPMLYQLSYAGRFSFLWLEAQHTRLGFHPSSLCPLSVVKTVKLCTRSVVTTEGLCTLASLRALRYFPRDNDKAKNRNTNIWPWLEYECPP
jgi:hypothetical protein